MDNIFDKLEIVVIGNHRKEILTTQYLKDIPHRVFYTTDYDFPEGFVNVEPQLTGSFQLGAYRCFRGHQDAINSCTKDFVLVFEDDAVPIRGNWIDIVKSGISLLNKFDIVSFHNRICNLGVCDRINVQNHIFYYPVRSGFWCTAALAYVVKRDFGKSFSNYVFDGVPVDILYFRKFKFCFLHQSPFLHDRRKGSLIDDYKPTGK